MTGVRWAVVEPELREGLEPSAVTPGLVGFLVTLAVVVACIPLFRSMTSKLRGVEHRGRREERAAERIVATTAGTATAAAPEPVAGQGGSAHGPEGTGPDADGGPAPDVDEG